MTGTLKVIFITLIAGSLLLMSAGGAFSATVQDITSSLTCTCGCNMIVSACEGSMECGPARKITAQVGQMLAAGKTKDEIIQYYVKLRGETILAAPTKKGFNLVAWILPFLGIILAGLGIFLFLNRTLAHRQDDSIDPDSSPVDRKISDKHLKQFENELQNFDS